MRPLTVDEKHNLVEIKKRETFTILIEKRWGTAMLPKADAHPDKEWSEYVDEVDIPKEVPEMEDSVDSTGKLIDQQPAYDKLINAEVQFQVENLMLNGKVTKRSVEPDGKQSGNYNDNPILNSLIYEVEFEDGAVREYNANTIAGNIISQVDEDGYSKVLMEGIVDYAKDDSVAVFKDDGL